MSELVASLEKQLEDSKAVIEQQKLLSKLNENYEFRKLFVEGFCRDEAARCVRLSVDVTLDAESRADALGFAQAAGYMMRYMNALHQMGEIAKRDIPRIEEALEEARAEEASE